MKRATIFNILGRLKNYGQVTKDSVILLHIRFVEE